MAILHTEEVKITTLKPMKHCFIYDCGEYRPGFYINTTEDIAADLASKLQATYRKATPEDGVLLTMLDAYFSVKHLVAIS